MGRFNEKIWGNDGFPMKCEGFPDVFREPGEGCAKALSGHHIGATQVATVGAFANQVIFPWAWLGVI